MHARRLHASIVPDYGGCVSGQPHDALFKAAFAQPSNAAALLRELLPPDLVACIDWSSLRLVSGAFVDASLRQRFSDLLFEVGTTIGRALIHLLCEHQSEPDDRMPLRYVRYMDGTWQREDERQRAARQKGAYLSPIIPILITNAPQGWTAPTRFHELFDPGLFAAAPALARYVPSFELLVDDLRRSSDDDIARRGLASLAKLTLWLLRDGRGGRVLDAIDRWAPLLDDLPRVGLETVLRYVFAVGGNDGVIWEKFHANLRQLAPRAEDETMSILDQWIREGEARGLEQGLEQGRVQTLTKQLALKFGELPESAKARIAGASASELERWLERVLFAATLAEVFADSH